MGRVSVIIAAIVALAAPALARAADVNAPPDTAASPSEAPPPTSEPPPIVVAPLVDDARPVPSPAPAPPAAAATTPAVAATARAAPTPRPKRETHGLALAAGLGFAYGFLGLQVRYDIPIARSLTISPFVAAGPAFGFLSGPVGVSTAVGARHRFVVDLGVAPLDWMLFSLHGTTVAERTIFGPLLAVGYERMSEHGWFWRGALEAAVETWSTAPVPVHPYLRLFPGVAFGRRIW